MASVLVTRVVCDRVPRYDVVYVQSRLDVAGGADSATVMGRAFQFALPRTCSVGSRACTCWSACAASKRRVNPGRDNSR